ncbi:MAG: DUF1700 domain-containing protein [Clostridia bacterium]|nr:DUF1700 domain-containing protein [Clostridia bacterium]
MTKQEFLAELERALAGFPQAEIDDRVSFYGEMIDDGIEEGIPESEVIAKIGSIDVIVSKTVSDVPISKLVKERVKPKRTLSALEIALIALGFPLWFSLLISALAVILAIYVVIWAIIISLWAVVLSLAACSIIGGALAVVNFINGNTPAGLAMVGACLFTAGIAVFAFAGCIAASKGIVRLTGKAVNSIKNKLLRKESSK